MKNLKFILILFLLSKSAISQSYKTSLVIEKAKSYLKSTVGEELFKYFELDPDSYYQYETKSGKTKFKKINKGSWTRGKFVKGNGIRFILNHPEFQYLYVNKMFTIHLDSELNLAKEIYIANIPKFLLRNEPSDWLTDNEIKSVIEKQNLKKPIKPITRRLEFNYKTEEFYWIVFNTLYKEKCFSDQEILHIDPINGIIKKHYEERQRKMHCYE
ncbi:MAG: hypothetical protein GYB35_15615 [Algicola sp.]|nr:hypothetical protein [Algicola sp.]